MPDSPDRSFMDATVRALLDHLHSKDKDLQNKAFLYMMEATSQPVGWAHDVWDEIVATLSEK
jgi:hypothetical protein